MDAGHFNDELTISGKPVITGLDGSSFSYLTGGSLDLTGAIGPSLTTSGNVGIGIALPSGCFHNYCAYQSKGWPGESERWPGIINESQAIRKLTR